MAGVEHRLQPGSRPALRDRPSDGKQYHDDRDLAEVEFRGLRQELVEWQKRLYAEGRQRLLVVLQAMDAGGKDSTIRHVFEGVNPQGVRVHSFKKPTPEELAHDFLWRVHRVVPAVGMIGVFNRSHYEDVLVVRVNELVSEGVWRQRYEQINHFEKLLVESGTTLLKFYLHISREEQRERFQDRVDEADKRWKFSREDLQKRKQWDAYMEAYEEALYRCSTPWAPWFIIPANQKWYRNLAVTRIIVAALRHMEPAYPQPEEALTGITIT